MKRATFVSMKPHEWPAIDRSLWEEAQRTSRLFGTHGFASRWRPATIRASEKGYGVYLSWLATEGLLDPAEPPAARISEARVEAFVERYSVGRSEHTIAGAVRGTAYALRAFNPPHGVLWLTQYAHQLSNHARPCNPKAAQIAPIIDIISASDRLMESGAALLADGFKSGAPIFRDGLMMGLLIRRPSMRVKNLAALRLGTSIILDGANTCLRIKASDTKAGFSIDSRIPQDIVEPLEFYVREVRPVLLGGSASEDQGWLWLGRRGRPMPTTDIAARMSRRTLTELGRAISPHRFRDCAATDIALNDPTLVGITKSVLGHRSLATSQRYYNQADSFSAFERYRAVVRKARSSFLTS